MLKTPAILATLLLPSSALALEVCFTPGAETTGLALIGDAVIDSGQLQVTAAAGGQHGALWFDQKVSTAGEVHAYFVADISGSGGGGGDGVALVMQNQEASPLGQGGGGLGYLDITPAVVVEFDTYTNGGDPNDNHVGITLGDPDVHLDTFTPGWTIEAGTTHVWVDYASGTLDVFVAQTATKPGTAQMSVSVDLATELGSDFWVGLTAATGAAFSRHAFSHVVFQEGALIDTDTDNVPDVCEDRDGDGIPDGVEDRDHTTFGDVDGDTIDAGDDLDSDGDGIDDAIEGSGDTDSDGTPDYLDTDADGDGIDDADELAADTAVGDLDGDGIPAWLDTDSDGDGIDDATEGNVDTDTDGNADYVDLDSDDDGTNDDTDPCRLDNPDDSDGDTVCESVDICTGDDATGDTDADGVCDDTDLCTGDDATGDTDGDGICNDSDDCDGDNTADADEDGVCDSADICTGDDNTGDADGDGICTDQDVCDGDDATGDTDSDGICDDIDACPEQAGATCDEGPDSGLDSSLTLQPGCECSSTAATGAGLTVFPALFLGLLGVRRRQS